MKKDTDKEKKNTPKEKKGPAAPAFNLSKKQKIWLGIATVILLLLLLVLAFFILKRAVFENNRHFIISAVKIDTQGKRSSYWNDPLQAESRSIELAKEIEIKPGIDNLFAQDLAAKRKLLLEKHPEMEDVQLIPILPDILQIRIRERLPVARLDATTYLIDKDSHIFASEYYAIAPALPSIKDETHPESFAPGQQATGSGIKFLMQFIRMMGEQEIQFHVVSAKIMEHSKGNENLGLRIEAHLKRNDNDFECQRVVFSYPEGIEMLRMQARALKAYALERNRKILKVYDARYGVEKP